MLDTQQVFLQQDLRTLQSIYYDFRGFTGSNGFRHSLHVLLFANHGAIQNDISRNQKHRHD